MALCQESAAGCQLIALQRLVSDTVALRPNQVFLGTFIVFLSYSGTGEYPDVVRISTEGDFD